MNDTTTPDNRAAAKARDVLAAGLAWLYDTPQPDGAILQHHGASLPPVGNRWFRFIPSGWGGRVVVVVDVAKVEWIDNGPNDLATPANPLEPDELDWLTCELAVLGVEVVHTWNGHPAITGSLALARPAHPSLLAAVERYRAGCPEHSGPLCSWGGCPWYGDGNALVVMPALPPAAETGDGA